MDTRERLDRIADYLAESFSGGITSLSRHDVIDDDGTVLGREVVAVVRLARREKLVVGDDNVVVEALDTFADAWGQGFDMASGDDMVTDEETVKEIVMNYVDNAPASPAPTPAP